MKYNEKLSLIRAFLKRSMGTPFFYSSYLQCEFNVKKQQKYDGKELMFLIEEELKNVKMLQDAVSENACIGYEAINHYYFNQNTLLEKIININCLINRI
jgi:hypothetical protein